MTTSFKLSIEFLNPQNPYFWSFWHTRFLAKYKVHRRRDIFTRRRASRLSFGHQQHHQVLRVCTLDWLLSAPCVTRNLGGDEHGFFAVDVDFLSYVPGMHVVGFTRSYYGSWALASTPICCSILQYTKRTKPSADTWAIDPWVRVVPFCFCASLSQSVCVRGDDVFLVAT